MLFSAGMGIGLVFWTTAEPISHAYKATPIHKIGTQRLMMRSSLHSSIGEFMRGQCMALLH